MRYWGYKDHISPETWCRGYLFLVSSYHDFIFSASQCHGFVSSKNISWFLDVTALWSLFLHVLVFRPLVKCLGISILLVFLSSILNLVAFCPKISILQFFGLGISMSCFIWMSMGCRCRCGCRVLFALESWHRSSMWLQNHVFTWKINKKF